MPNYSDMLVYLRKRKGLSQQELAKELNMTRSAISMYETGQREPSLEVFEEFADFYNVDMNTLTGSTGKSTALTSVSGSSFPLIGDIACGSPILAEENISEYIRIPEDIQADFCLRCKGDSMINARIYDGDIVFIRKQEQVENGQIAAVRIGDEATLKKVYYTPGSDRITLRPCNPLYPDMEYEGERLNDIDILGKAVSFLSNIR